MQEMTLITRLRNVLENNVNDVFAVILCVSAIGLIPIPEIVYVKDIYYDSYKERTQCLLTYQAFIMFGLAAGTLL